MPREGAAVCFGEVVHRRLRPAVHAFRYPVFFLRVPLASLGSAPRVRLDRLGVFSFHAADHGPRDGSPLLPWIHGLLAREGVVADGEIVLQTFPRVFGYVFNPVSFWFCHDTEGQLRAVLCEVNNTFGESHNYLVRHADLRPIASGEVLEASKVFHVSPFFPVSGNYRFRFLAQPGQAGVNIEYRKDGQLALLAHVGGRARPLAAGRLLGALLRFPFMTLGVMARIHWHALLLWRKGAIFHRKPNPPLERTT
jgi:DUF1365 family protein